MTFGDLIFDNPRADSSKVLNIRSLLGLGMFLANGIKHQDSPRLALVRQLIDFGGDGFKQCFDIGVQAIGVLIGFQDGGRLMTHGHVGHGCRFGVRVGWSRHLPKIMNFGYKRLLQMFAQLVRSPSGFTNFVAQSQLIEVEWSSHERCRPRTGSLNAGVLDRAATNSVKTQVAVRARCSRDTLGDATALAVIVLTVACWGC